MTTCEHGYFKATCSICTQTDQEGKQEKSDRRDCFVMAALEGLERWDDETPEEIAERAALIADAVIKYLDEHPT